MTPPTRHGTPAAYNKGCRCQPCRDAKAESRQRCRDRKHRPDTVPHDREALRDLLHDLFPDGMTSPEERRRHKEPA